YGAPPAVDLARFVHLVPQPRDIQRVLADQDVPETTRGDMAERGFDDRLADSGVGVRLADAGDALIGLDADQADRLAAIADRLHPRQPEHDRLDVGDLHRAVVGLETEAVPPSTNVNLSDRFAQMLVFAVAQSLLTTANPPPQPAPARGAGAHRALLL